MSLATGRVMLDPSERASASRDAVRDALATVPGLTAYTSNPDQAVAGAAWPKWVQNLPGGSIDTVILRVYEVLVTLPASYARQTTDEGDAFADPVWFALAQLGEVTFAEPAQIVFNDRQTMPGLRFRITTH